MGKAVFNGENRKYFLGLPLARQMQYLRDTYGVQPSVHVIVTETHTRELMVFATATLINFVERAEWGGPEASVFTRKLKVYQDLNQAAGEALARLVDLMLEAVE